MSAELGILPRTGNVVSGDKCSIELNVARGILTVGSARSGKNLARATGQFSTAIQDEMRLYG